MERGARILPEQFKRIVVRARRIGDKELLKIDVTRYGETKTLRQWYSYFLHMPDTKIDCFCPVCTGEAMLVK